MRHLNLLQLGLLILNRQLQLRNPCYAPCVLGVQIVVLRFDVGEFVVCVRLVVEDFKLSSLRLVLVVAVEEFGGLEFAGELNRWLVPLPCARPARGGWSLHLSDLAGSRLQWKLVP